MEVLERNILLMKKNDYNEKELEDKKIYLDTKIMELRNLKEEAEKQGKMEDYYSYNLQINCLRDKKDKINQKIFNHKKDLIGNIKDKY